jgi:hypothetical protein
LDAALDHHPSSNARGSTDSHQHLRSGGENSSLTIAIVAMVMLFYSSVSLAISAALNYDNKLVQLAER